MTNQRVDWTVAAQSITVASTLPPVVNKLLALTDVHVSNLLTAFEIDPNDPVKMAMIKEHVSTIALDAVEVVVNSPVWLLKAAEQVNQGNVPDALIRRYWNILNEHG